MNGHEPSAVPPAASALAAGVLLATAACSGGDGPGAAEQARAVEQPEAVRAPSGSSTASPGASPSVLSESGARSALVTEADLERDWNQVRDADNWRDRLLVGEVDVSGFLTARADAADCQRLLDGLCRNDLLGEPSEPSALIGCEQGDAREGLHVTVRGRADDIPVTLALDVAAVRVGTSALTVTGGGLDGGQAASVERAVRQGTERLTTVLDGGTPAPLAGDVDCHPQKRSSPAFTASCAHPAKPGQRDQRTAQWGASDGHARLKEPVRERERPRAP
ncbi:hypothetical protein [Streptomyces olivaceus]|uniref:hypothetical protein n=1 Tax=Streptomyces olivaceus TaxID=47716 RepID=UPI0036A432D6